MLNEAFCLAWSRFSLCNLQAAEIFFFFFSFFCSRFCLQHLLQCMCGNNMSVPLLAEAVTVSGVEKETAAVSESTKPNITLFTSNAAGVFFVALIKQCF